MFAKKGCGSGHFETILHRLPFESTTRESRFESDLLGESQGVRFLPNERSAWPTSVHFETWIDRVIQNRDE